MEDKPNSSEEEPDSGGAESLLVEVDSLSSSHEDVGEQLPCRSQRMRRATQRQRRLLRERPGPPGPPGAPRAAAQAKERDPFLAQLALITNRTAYCRAKEDSSSGSSQASGSQESLSSPSSPAAAGSSSYASSSPTQPASASAAEDTDLLSEAALNEVASFVQQCKSSEDLPLPHADTAAGMEDAVAVAEVVRGGVDEDILTEAPKERTPPPEQNVYEEEPLAPPPPVKSSVKNKPPPKHETLGWGRRTNKSDAADRQKKRDAPPLGARHANMAANKPKASPTRSPVKQTKPTARREKSEPPQTQPRKTARKPEAFPARRERSQAPAAILARTRKNSKAKETKSETGVAAKAKGARTAPAPAPAPATAAHGDVVWGPSKMGPGPGTRRGALARGGATKLTDRRPFR